MEDLNEHVIYVDNFNDNIRIQCTTNKYTTMYNLFAITWNNN